jgi:hypothetical protein
MKLGFLMIILTMLDDGGLSAAFVNTQTLEECRDRAAVVRAILEQGEQPIEQLVCRASQARFEPFVHGADADAERRAYLISIDDEIATVEPVASCDAAAASRDGRHCATATQKPLSQPQ